jgi:hypothetical protein
MSTHMYKTSFDNCQCLNVYLNFKNVLCSFVEVLGVPIAGDHPQR